MIPFDQLISWISVALIVAFVFVLRSLVFAMKETEVELHDLNRMIERLQQPETKKRKSHLSQAGIEMWLKRNLKRRKGIRR